MIKTGKLWKALFAAIVRDKQLCGAANVQPADAQQQQQQAQQSGIVANHAYALLDASENELGAGVCAVRVRNPLGAAGMKILSS